MHFIHGVINRRNVNAKGIVMLFGAPSMTLHAFHPWCDKQTQCQRQGSCDVVCKLFAKLPSLVPLVPVVLQELVECVPGLVTFCDAEPLGPMLEAAC